MLTESSNRGNSHGRTAPRPDYWPAVELSDAGNAYRFRKDHGDLVRHVNDWNSFLLWDGFRWGHDRARQAEQLAKETVGRLFRESIDGIDLGDKEAMKAAEAKIIWAKRSHSAKAITAMLNLARSEPGIAMLPEQFDTDHWVLNTPTGTLDLRTGKVRPHRQADFLTTLCHTPYNSAARCPAWEKFLDLVFAGDLDLIGFIRRLFGYSLTGQTSEHILAVFWGTGANGKSTLLETVLEVMGVDYAMKAPPSMLMDRAHETHPTERADLLGKRLVCAVETEDGKRLAESLVKELTGGDTIRARWMRENFFEFAPTHKLILCSNHKPLVRGADNGIWRRLRLIPFEVRFWNPDEPPSPGEDRPDHFVPTSS